MLIFVAFALGFLGGLTYARMKVISGLLLLIVILFKMGAVEFPL